MIRFNRSLARLLKIQFRTSPCGHSTIIHQLSTQSSHLPKRKSRFGLYTLGTLILTSGGALVYAKFNDEFRKEVCEYVPYANEAIKTLFQEERSYSDTVSMVLGVGPDAATDQRASSSSRESGKPVEKPSEKPVLQSPPQIFRPVLTIEDLQDIERKILDHSAQLALSYKIIGKLLEEHVVFVSQTIDDCTERLKPSLSPVIEEQTKSLILKLAEEEDKVKKNLEHVNELRVKVRDSKLEGSKDLIEVSKRRIEQSAAAIKDSAASITDSRNFKLLADQAWQKLEKTRTEFVEELHTLFPSLNIEKKQLDLDAPEIDLFLLYSYLQVKMLKDKISKLEANRVLRIKRALSSLTTSEEDQEKIGNLVSEEVTTMKRDMELKMKKKIQQLKAQCEAEVNQQLARATEVHLLTVADLELQQEAKLVEKHSIALQELLKTAQEDNQKVLSDMQSQLKEVEDLVKSRSDADYGAHRSQVLWATCHSLVRSLKRLQPLKTYNEKCVSIKEGVTAILTSTLEKDPMVAAVVRGIPEEAITRGVFTEEALIERFKKVEKVSKGVALVPDQGGILPLYLLSWIQSWLLTVVPDFTSSSEKLAHPISSDISTLEALHEARYWIDRGDLLQALKFMNLVKGYSRRVAADWIHETRIHLETLQAAEALMAHAVSMGMV